MGPASVALSVLLSYTGVVTTLPSPVADLVVVVVDVTSGFGANVVGVGAWVSLEVFFVVMPAFVCVVFMVVVFCKTGVVLAVTSGCVTLVALFSSDVFGSETVLFTSVVLFTPVVLLLLAVVGGMVVWTCVVVGGDDTLEM